MINVNIKKLIEEDGIMFMTYVGFMSQGILSGMIESIEQEQVEIPNKKNHVIFTVLIEMSQNIMKYSKNSSDTKINLKSKGLILVAKNEDDIYVHSQNIITLEDRQRIEERLEEIKQLNKDEIKLKYRELRRNAINSHKNGAGIGFYEIAKRTKNIEYEFEKINDNCYNFYLTAYID